MALSVCGLGLEEIHGRTTNRPTAGLRVVARTASGPANVSQKRFAHRFGLAFSESATGWELSGKLFQFLLARVFVFSVYRKLTGAKWRFFRESSLGDETVNSVARVLCCEPRCLAEIERLSVGSSTTGDQWHRLSGGSTQSAAFELVSRKLQSIVKQVYVAGTPEVPVENEGNGADQSAGQETGQEGADFDWLTPQASGLPSTTARRAKHGCAMVLGILVLFPVLYAFLLR